MKTFILSVLPVAWMAVLALADSNVVENIYELETLFVEQQYSFLPISTPSEEVLLQPCGSVVPVDWKEFPKAFTKQVYAQMDENGYPVYRVKAYEDPTTRETVFLNSFDAEIYRLDAEENYNPYAWQ